MSGRWRGTWMFAGIAAALAAVFGLRVLSIDGTTTSTAGAPTVATGGGAGGSAGRSGSGAASGGAASGGGGSSSGGSAASGGAGSSGSSGSSTGSSSGGTSAASGTQTIQGDAEQTQFGPYQVEVTFSGSKITRVTELQTPQDGHSLAINQYAAPTLEREVIASQSARIDSVSGATLTSEAYAASVQSAIDKRG